MLQGVETRLGYVAGDLQIGRAVEVAGRITALFPAVLIVMRQRVDSSRVHVGVGGPSESAPKIRSAGVLMVDVAKLMDYLDVVDEDTRLIRVRQENDRKKASTEMRHSTRLLFESKSSQIAQVGHEAGFKADATVEAEVEADANAVAASNNLKGFDEEVCDDGELESRDFILTGSNDGEEAHPIANSDGIMVIDKAIVKSDDDEQSLIKED